MKTKILFLDDDQRRHIQFKRVISEELGNNTAVIKSTYTAKDCIADLSKDEYDFIFLDHDLGGETYVDSTREDCGMEVVRWLCQNPIRCDTIILHSLNVPAVQEMYNKLHDSKYVVIVKPFTEILSKGCFHQ